MTGHIRITYPSAAAAQPEADAFCGCQGPVWASYLEIGNPTQNSYVERFNRTNRDEILTDDP